MCSLRLKIFIACYSTIQNFEGEFHFSGFLNALIQGRSTRGVGAKLGASIVGIKNVATD